MNKIKLAVISFLVLLLSCVAYSRSIKDEDAILPSSSSSSSSAFLSSHGLTKTENCEPTYGILPCSSNAWGLLFLIVVYEILLSFGGKYVGMGSELFFEIIGPGIFGGSLFQILGTIPQIVLVLVSALSGSQEEAQQRAKLGMGLVAGTTVMLLTLIWGTSVILGSYNLSNAVIADASGSQKDASKTGFGVVTDVETSYIARIMPFTLIPFLFILLANVISASSARRAIILVALLFTFVLLFAYIFYQIFQPWIQNRRFEYLMNKYAKDKLLTLLSRNGKPDSRKIQQLFDRIDKDKSASLSAAELRVLLLGVRIDDDNLTTDRDVENVLASFDTSGDGRIGRDEFIRGMQDLVTNLSDQDPDRIKKTPHIASQGTSDAATQALLAGSNNATAPSMKSRATNSWTNYLKASFLVIVGTLMLCLLGQPLINSVVAFAEATNLSSFAISYLAIPFAMNYGAALQSIAAARQKTQKSISLTLSALYTGVYMNNVIGLIVFLAPVYALNLSANVFSEIVVVLAICVLMTVLASVRTVYARWMGYVVLLLYPISLALIYLATAVLGLP